jgi:hypothetical protein
VTGVAQENRHQRFSCGLVGHRDGSDRVRLVQKEPMTTLKIVSIVLFVAGALAEPVGGQPLSS